MTIQLGNGICSWDPLELLHRARASDANTAWALLNDALAKAGFGHAFYTFGVPISSTQPLRDKFERGILGGERFVDTFFPEFMKRPKLLAQDPVAAHCKRSMTPFVWSSASLAPRERTGLALAYDFDISAFIAFPLRNGQAPRVCSTEKQDSVAREYHRSGERSCDRSIALTACPFFGALKGVTVSRRVKARGDEEGTR